MLASLCWTVHFRIAALMPTLPVSRRFVKHFENLMRYPGIRAPRAALWLARGLIGLVLVWNVQAAFVFLAAPAAYAPGFELTGAPGQAMVRGMAVLFLMWNVPYAVALWDPVRRRVSLYEAFAMQAIGLIGECLIRWSLGAGHPVAAASVARFIAFDAAGLFLLALAAWIVRRR